MSGNCSTQDPKNDLCIHIAERPLSLCVWLSTRSCDGSLLFVCVCLYTHMYVHENVKCVYMCLHLWDFLSYKMRAGPGDHFSDLRGTGTFYSLLENAGALLIREDSSWLPPAVCSADSHFLKEVLHLLCGSQCGTRGFCVLRGRACPHLHSLEGR